MFKKKNNEKKIDLNKDVETITAQKPLIKSNKVQSIVENVK